MSKSLFIAAAGPGVDKAGIVRGCAENLRAKEKTVAIFAPIRFEDTVCDAEYALTLAEAGELVNAGKRDRIIERVLLKHAELVAANDYVLAFGTDYSGSNPAFEFDLNMELALNLQAAVLLVTNGAGKDIGAAAAEAKLALTLMREKSVFPAVVAVCGGEFAGEDPRGFAEAVAPADLAVINAGKDLSSELDKCVELLSGCSVTVRPPKVFEFGLIERARKHRMRIVLPEGVEPRVLKAAEEVSRRGVARVILLGMEDQVRAKAAEAGVSLEGIDVFYPLSHPRFEEYAQAYYEARKHKGVDIEKARKVMTDPSYFGTMMVQMDDADGMVSGSVNTTAHTIRPALEFVKTKPGASIVSSCFFMCLKDRVTVFADCAVNPNPTPQQLADIAVSTARTAAVFGVEPRVAMLSYSTGASGKGPDVDAVIEATRIAREKAPDLKIDGPLQYDAATDPRVAVTKLPNSEVAGRATVFIFPDLNTGNNCYKAVQRAADAVAVGPVLQGLKKPVNDLSRGCTVPDIINTVAVTAVQAQADKGLQ